MVRFIWILLILSVQLTWGQTTESDLFQRGKHLLRNEAYESAVRDFSYVLQLNSQHKEARLYRAVAYLEMQNAQIAYEDLTRQLDLHGSNGEVYFYRARAAMTLGEYAMALDDIKIALILKPKEASYHHQKSRVLITLKQYEAGLEAINKAIRFAPERVDYLYDRIEIWLGLDQTDYALRDCALLARIRPRDARVYTVRASIHFQKGERRAACKDWGAAAAMGDKSVLTLIQQFCDQRMEYSRNK